MGTALLPRPSLASLTCHSLPWPVLTWLARAGPLYELEAAAVGEP